MTKRRFEDEYQRYLDTLKTMKARGVKVKVLCYLKWVEDEVTTYRDLYSAEHDKVMNIRR